MNEKVKSGEALRIGLVSKVFPSSTFRADVAALAAGLAAAPPLALKRIKANLVDSDRLTFEVRMRTLTITLELVSARERECENEREIECAYVCVRRWVRIYRTSVMCLARVEWGSYYATCIATL